MWVELDDGGALEVALERYPRLLRATPEQRAQVWIGYEGHGLHWDEIDEDIWVSRLIARDEELRASRAVAAESVPMASGVRVAR